MTDDPAWYGVVIGHWSLAIPDSADGSAPRAPAEEGDHAGEHGGVLGVDAGGELAVGVEEHVAVLRAEAAGVVPADVQVRIKDVLAAAGVVRAVAVKEGAEVLVRRLVGQQGDARRVPR